MISKLQLRYDPVTVGGGLYFLWCLLNMLIPGQLPMTAALIYKLTLIGAIYLVVRFSPRKEWVLWLLTAAGVAQAVYALGQQAGFIVSNHSLFPVTGFMGNPGQLGGFQAVAFLAASVLAVKNVSRKLRLLLLYPFLALIAWSLYLADSRAGWVAVVAGLIVIYWSGIRRLFIARRWLIAPILFVAILSAVALYGYRSESVKGRLLIWRVTADMVADKPLAGYGAGGFNRHYMLYQARFFERHPDSEFLMVADNAAYPYNEFLHVLVEQGIVGLLLFLAVIVAAFATTTDKRMLAPFAGLLAFSLFSYPSYKFGLLILFPILLGCTGRADSLPQKSHWRYGIMTASLTVIAVISFNEIRFYSKVHENERKLMSHYDDCAAGFLYANFDRLSSSLRYNSLCLYWILKYPEIWDESKLSGLFPNCENWCALGDYYARVGMYDNAATYYRTASRMIPTRRLPAYRLWKLYREQGNTKLARQLAEQILSQPLKVENTFTLRTKAEVERWYAKLPNSRNF